MNEKHIEEARRVGLELIDDSPLVKDDGLLDFNYKRYKVVGCGHEGFFQPTHVRRNNVQCKPCLEDEISETLFNLGFKVISDGSIKQTKLVQNMKCGHVYEIRQGMRNVSKSYKCTECYDLKITKDAIEKDLTYIGESEKGGVYRKFKFNKCGHLQDIHAPCIAVGRFRCQQCKEDKYKEEAAKVGLEYIGLANNTKYECQRRLYKLPCGCKKEIRMDHAASGSYLCDNCDESYYTQPSSVYLLKITSSDFSWLKFGYSKNVTNRCGSYGLTDEYVEILTVKSFSSGFEAMRFEKSIHKKYKSERYKKATMKKYLKNSGFTECYPLEFESILLKELNE